MKTLAVFLLLLGITSTFASWTSLKNLEKTVREDALGQSVLSLIDMNMRLNTPVEDVQNALAQILAALQAENDAATTNYNTHTTLLNTQIQNGRIITESASNTISVLQASLEADQESLRNKQTELSEAQDRNQAETDALAQLEQSYQNYVPRAETDVQSLTSAITAINNAIGRMQAYKTSGIERSIFLQVSSNLEKDLKKATDVLEKMTETVSKSSSIYTPIVKELLALTENLTQDRADTVIGLLSQLLTVLQNTQTSVQQQLSDFTSSYNTDKTNHQSELDRLREVLRELNDSLGALQSKITTGLQQVDAAVALRDDATARTQQAQEELGQVETAYAQAQARNQRLISLMNQVINAFNNQVAEAGSDNLAALNSP